MCPHRCFRSNAAARLHAAARRLMYCSTSIRLVFRASRCRPDFRPSHSRLSRSAAQPRRSRGTRVDPENVEPARVRSRDWISPDVYRDPERDSSPGQDVDDVWRVGHSTSKTHHNSSTSWSVLRRSTARFTRVNGVPGWGSISTSTAAFYLVRGRRFKPLM